MNPFTKSLPLLIALSMIGLNLSAQYGTQLDNRGFEQWTTRDVNSVSEPVHWHSSGTATGTFAGFLPDNQVEESGHTRPGSSGSKSVKLFPDAVMGVTANGSVTNGRMNAGSMSAAGANNYNYTQRSENVYNTPLTQVPDSLSVWVCFRSQSTTDRANVRAVIHGDADYRIIANGTESPADMHVASAYQAFTRTSTAGGAYTWQRLSIPFVNNGPCTDPRYILFVATTNETPGSGSTSDDLFLDDVLLIYNPSLSMGNLASTNLAPHDALTIPFTLTGTMSPDNLNATANEVIVQMSNANGSFSYATELGRVTTNTSGSITVEIPEAYDGQYSIRVISTNYPMIGGNIQQINITNPVITYNITATANPSNGGTVSGAGSYEYGATCTLTAEPNTNYDFAYWTKDGVQVSSLPTLTLTVTATEEYVAHFLEVNSVEEAMTYSQIFPNPFTSTVSIRAEKPIMKVSVFNVYGSLVMEQSVSETGIDLDLSDLSDGTYLLQLDYGDSRSVHHIVKFTK